MMGKLMFSFFGEKVMTFSYFFIFFFKKLSENRYPYNDR